MNGSKEKATLIAKKNIRHFIVFRLLFNARFYYPIFAVIFLDFGLTLDQFAILNAIWAATIIMAEVPSGALSDLMGRKKLLIMTAALMVVEIAVWAFAPTDNPTLLFWLLALNRIFSGLGEASASGSDEALVYDSLEEAGMEKQWASVLEKVSQMQSIAFVVTMILGGLMYDPNLLNKVIQVFAPAVEIEKSDTMRLPLYFTLLTSLICLVNNFRFCETEPHENTDQKPGVIATFKQTLGAGKWILKTPFALVIIMAGAFADSVMRMFVTLGSEYYRLINYPEFALGFIGAGVAGMNFFVAPIAKRLVENRSPGFNFMLVSIVGTLCFAGAAFLVPWVGIIFAIGLFALFFIVSFSLSFYLNKISQKSNRATVLSFKGMALNLGYGFIGILYAQLLRLLSDKKGIPSGSDELFGEGVFYFAPYFLIGSIIITVFTLIICRDVNTIAARLKDKKVENAS